MLAPLPPEGAPHTGRLAGLLAECLTAYPFALEIESWQEVGLVCQTLAREW
jgi:hypothetical protein